MPRANSSESKAWDLIPPRPSLSALKNASTGCRACDLWKKGTQTVFGEGARRANVMFVGEQPGNEEDLTGKPFVGPAGRLFDNALEAAGIDRKQTYVTNVVKHFKWEPRGKRRIHKKPNSTEIAACRPWLETEIALIKPDVIVALGATAAQSLSDLNFESQNNAANLFPQHSHPTSWPQSTPHRFFAPRMTKHDNSSCDVSSTI